MTWALSPVRYGRSANVGVLLLAMGKALYLAGEFERKCQYIWGLLELYADFDASGDPDGVLQRAMDRKDQLLGPTLNDIRRLVPPGHTDVSILMEAKLARNAIAHDVGKLGSLRGVRARDVQEAVAALRIEVLRLARGENVISVWEFEIQEKRRAPAWMVKTYEARVMNWVFGDPFEEPNPDGPEWLGR